MRPACRLRDLLLILRGAMSQANDSGELEGFPGLGTPALRPGLQNLPVLLLLRPSFSGGEHELL